MTDREDTTRSRSVTRITLKVIGGIALSFGVTYLLFWVIMLVTGEPFERLLALSISVALSIASVFVAVRSTAEH